MNDQFDRPLGFAIPAQDARGRVVRLGPVLDTILSAHQYPPAAEKILAEALVLTALLGATLKDEQSQLTMQAQTENGPISLLVCDYLGGQLRGHLAFDEERLAAAGTDPSLFALFGKGYLALTFDQAGTDARYQGVVPLEGHSLSEAVERYFRQSEQLPTVLRVAVEHRTGAGCVAGGLLLQQLAQSEEGHERLAVRGEAQDGDDLRWEHVSTLAETLTAAELVDVDLSLESIVWRLFHDEEEVRVSPGGLLTRGCRCDPAYIASVLSRFPDEERAEMVGDDGLVTVDCAFCSKSFGIDPGAALLQH